MVSIAERIARSGLKLQLILICGRNQKLRERLRAVNPGFPMYESITAFAGATPVPLPLREENGFRVDPEELACAQLTTPEVWPKTATGNRDAMKALTRLSATAALLLSN